MDSSFLFHIQFSSEKTHWFNVTWFLEWCWGHGISGTLSVNSSGVETIADSIISLNCCCLSHLPECSVLFLDVLKKSVFKKPLLHNEW